MDCGVFLSFSDQACSVLDKKQKTPTVRKENDISFSHEKCSFPVLNCIWGKKNNFKTNSELRR